MDYGSNGMLEPSPLVDQGPRHRSLVDSLDHYAWSNNSLPTERTRARRHGQVPRLADRRRGHCRGIHHELGGAQEHHRIPGVSMGAHHAGAVHLGRAVPPLWRCALRAYDPTQWHGWGDPGDTRPISANPSAYVPNLHGDHLDRLRSRPAIQLVVPAKVLSEVHPTKSLLSAQQLHLLAERESPTTSTCGIDNATTGRGGASSWPTPSPALSSDRPTTQEDPMANQKHLIGLSSEPRGLADPRSGADRRTGPITGPGGTRTRSPPARDDRAIQPA